MAHWTFFIKILKIIFVYEREIFYDPTLSDMLVSFDIDGILTNYPECWVHYANNQLGTNYDSKRQMKTELGPIYSEIKSKYRKSNYKANLTPQKKFVDVVKHLDENGKEIVIATSRPIESNEFPDLRDMTEEWLIKNDIPYTRLMKKTSLADLNVNYHIDDELEDAIKVARFGATVFYYSQQQVNCRYITPFNDPITLLELIE